MARRWCEHLQGESPMARLVSGLVSERTRGASMIEPWVNVLSALVTVGLFLGTVRLRRA
jgi:hypothetical protein